MNNQKFRKLNVWIKAIDFIEGIYRLTRKFPMNEEYGLIGQLRRASVSIALNIAEGSGKNSDKELNRYLEIALGSIYETLAGFDILYAAKLIEKKDFEEMTVLVSSISNRIGGLKKKLKS